MKRLKMWLLRFAIRTAFGMLIAAPGLGLSHASQAPADEASPQAYPDLAGTHPSLLAFNQFAEAPEDAPGDVYEGRVIARHEILKHFEWGVQVSYVGSQIGQQSDIFSGNLLLINGERRWKSLRSPAFVGGRVGGGFYLTPDGLISGGLGYLGPIFGFEFGDRPVRLDLTGFAGLGGGRISQEIDGIVYYESRGFYVLSPSVDLIFSTSPYSSIALSAGYWFIPFGVDGQNLGGPGGSVAFLFNL